MAHTPSSPQDSPGRVIAYTLPDGWQVLVGRTDADNDHLSFRVARPGDGWFHVRGMPGSHGLFPLGCPPRRHRKRPWPKPLRRWLAGVRQMVETVHDKRHHPFRLDRERPHELRGLPARLAAKIALHNFCIWLHEQLGRPRLAFTDLVDW